MKDDKNIRYVGFACGPDGARSLEFSFRTPGCEAGSTTFDIAGIFFKGENRIMVQEAAGICYSKLRDLLANAPEVSTRCLITGNDIGLYRQVAPSRQGRHTLARDSNS